MEVCVFSVQVYTDTHSMVLCHHTYTHLESESVSWFGETWPDKTARWKVPLQQAVLLCQSCYAEQWQACQCVLMSDGGPWWTVQVPPAHWNHQLMSWCSSGDWFHKANYGSGPDSDKGRMSTLVGWMKLYSTKATDKRQRTNGVNVARSIRTSNERCSAWWEREQPVEMQEEPGQEPHHNAQNLQVPQMTHLSNRMCMEWAWMSFESSKSRFMVM